MSMTLGLLLAMAVLTMVVTPGECQLFYPFGTAEGDTIGPIMDDGFLPAINIPGGFPIFGTSNTLLYVNLNGAFTFNAAYGGYTPTSFPVAGVNIVAPYWADVDVRRNAGRLYYRTSTDPTLLTRATNDVRTAFSTHCMLAFRATWIFIATWDRVTYYGGSSTTAIHSFQGILITDGTRSFTMFNYGTPLTWTTGTASGGNPSTGFGGTAAQVGFNAANGFTYHFVPGSLTNAIVNIYQQSNVGITGRWMFRLDLIFSGLPPCILNPTNCTLSNSTGLCAGSGRCAIQGDSHYVTFDGRRFDYQGVCKYLVARPKVRSATLPYFQVFARGENRYGDTSVSWAYYVEIVYGTEKIRFRRVGTTSTPPTGTVVVTINGRSVSTPRCICGSDYSIYMVGNFMRFITTFSLVVEYDGRSQVIVIVPPQYGGNKLTGICGNFDGSANNDIFECNGRKYLGTNANFFGDTCVVPDPEPNPCNASIVVPPPAPTNPCLTNPPQRYVNICGVLRNTAGPFATCLAQLDALVPGTSTVLYNNCILDACLSGGRELCNNIWSLVEQCSDLGFTIDCKAWLKATGCAMICPAGSGMVFSCDAPSICLPTCSNPTVENTCTRPNRAACVCPLGTILNDGVCTNTCPNGCVDSTGVLRRAGETWLGPECTRLTCTAYDTCASRFRVDSVNMCSTDAVCVNSRCVVIPRVCWCAGDPHCWSFDGLYPIDYQGFSEFLLAGVFNESEGVTAFQVYALNDDYFSPGNTAVSYVAQVRLVFGAIEIKLTRDFTQWPPVTLRVNGVVTTVPYTGAGYTVYYAGLSVRIVTSFGVVVEYDGYATASVTVPLSYRRRLRGLCGNFDGNVDNDWTTADGRYVGNETRRASLLGDSYIVRSNTTRVYFEGATLTPNPNNCERYYEIEKLCTESIKASEECVKAVGAEVAKAFIAACIMDGCLAQSSLPACAVLSKFFELCSQQGVSVSCSDWQKAGCDVLLANPNTGRCPAGLTYKCDAPACTPTCDNPNPREGCTLPNREGCVCPDGQLLAANGTCYKICPVGCETESGLQPPNTQFIPSGLTPGRIINVTLTPGQSRFSVNLRHSDGGDIAFHFNPRLSERVVVRNTLVGGEWQAEERQQPSFPFAAGQQCTIMILCESNQFKVAVNGQHFVEYRLRTGGLQLIQLVEVSEDMALCSLFVQ